MDRAEAVKRVIEPDAGYDHAHAFVDSLVALGLLKLEIEPVTLCGEDPDWNWWLSQPKEFKAAAVKEFRAKQINANTKFCEATIKYVDPDHWLDFLSGIALAGLKIVEK